MSDLREAPMWPFHQPRSVIVNGRHVWECAKCGRRWNPDVAVNLIERGGCDE